MVRTLTLSLLLAGIAGAAQAHPAAEHANGFVAGLVHPPGGLDHLLAMVAVGLWASQLGGRALWQVPTVFVAVMVLGGAAGFAGIAPAGIEAGILASLLILGLVVAASVRLHNGAAMLLVGAFALCHGLAHGGELPAAASPLGYTAGFVIATSALHLLGLGIGAAATRLSAGLVTRIAGAGVAAAGLALAVG
jgi:urease accessory protein